MKSNLRLSEFKKRQSLIISDGNSYLKKIKIKYLTLRLSRNRSDSLMHIAKIITKKIFNRLKIHSNHHHHHHHHHSRGRGDGDGDEKSFCIRITGGIGDAVIIARLIQDLSNSLESYTFDIYFNSPHIIEPFFKNINGFRSCLHIDIHERTKEFYRFTLICNQYIHFEITNKNLKNITRSEPTLLKLFSTSEATKEKYKKFIHHHPYLDGAFADKVVKNGSRRYTFLHESLGINYSGNALPIDIKEALPTELIGKKYITIHDGWDGNFPLSTERPTKAIPIEKWNEIIKNLKALHPEYYIVQLGGSTGSDLENVDLNLKNKINFSEATAVLAKSELHIDAESGLVHIATALNVKCLVMFGPTNIDWFSYPENINIKPTECGNCWWTTQTWMEHCVENHTHPVCTKSISTELITKHASAYLIKKNTLDGNS